jgi:hypothetical protein
MSYESNKLGGKTRRRRKHCKTMKNKRKSKRRLN